MTLEPKKRAEILKAVKKLVLAHHINVAGIDYGAWAQSVDKKTPGLLASDLAGFEAGVRELLGELKTSHSVFYHSLPRESLPQLAINASFRDVPRNGGHKWMFLDVFQDGPAHVAGIKPGDILDSVDGKPSLPPTMPTFGVGHRHVLQVTKPAHGCQKEIAVEVPKRKGTKQRPPIVEPKSPIHEKIANNIGLLKIVYFPGAMGMGFANALDYAMSDLKGLGCDRLIVDLRGNIGGGLGLARLASYMCPGRVAIGHSLTPHRLRNGYDPEQLPRVPMPRSRAELLITLARYSFRDKSVILLTQSLGEQPFHRRIVVLVNEWTNSAAEMLTAFAKENRFATVIGQKTRGNVLGAANFRVGSGYWLRLPVFGWFTSQGSSLEGNGVDPDVAIEISPEGLAAGHDNQMERAIEIVNSL